MTDYQISIKSNAGTIAATVTGDLPDGEHVITGHQDGSVTTLHAERRSELGHPVIEAEMVTGPQPEPLRTDIPREPGRE